MSRYRGRFAPSPTGPLHAGSLVAALASWLDARAHDGQWLVRIEDVDRTRCVKGIDELILQQLAACGLQSDLPVLYQSKRSERYQKALQSLLDQDKAYPCCCTRTDITQALAQAGIRRSRHDELVYPGTCGRGLLARPARTWRFRTQPGLLSWHDRQHGAAQQNVQQAVGDFVLKRADGCFAYQLAVVVDDADQGISDVVRGQDLSDNTARQIQLQEALGLARPRYLHTPVVLAPDGHKLSKQNGALPVDTSTPEAATLALAQAAEFLQLPQALPPSPDPPAHWVAAWRKRWHA